VTGWRYTLTADISLPIPPHLAPRGVFRSEWMELVPDLLHPGWWVRRVRKPYSTDGCTAVKDFSFGATLSRCLHVLRHEGARAALRLCGPLIAHWGHAPDYQFAAEMAAAWGCSIWAVIRWANDLFDWTMEVCDTPKRQRRLYAAGVRVLGHPFAWAGRQWRALRARAGTQCQHAGEDKGGTNEHE